MNLDAKLDALFDEIDDLLLAGEFEKCDLLLQMQPVESMTLAELLVILTATLRAKDKLPSRAYFYGRVRAAADSALAGLE